MRGVLVALAAALAITACTEDITVPGGCPDFCPGGQPQLRDTTFLALEAGDSSYFGYSGWSEISSLLVADDFGAGDAVAWYRLPPRVDSLFLLDSLRPYTVDSVVIQVGIVARDTTVRGLSLYFYQLGSEPDSLTDYATLDAQMTPDALVDSLVVPDSVARGGVSLVLRDSTLDRLVVPPHDSGGITLAIRVGGGRETGVRLGSLQGQTGPAQFITYATVDVADTTLRRQVIALSADGNGYALTGVPPPDDTDLLYLGRTPTARSLLRFSVPRWLLDSTTVVRASLELTPARPLTGLPGDEVQVEAYPVTADLGAKSTRSFAGRAIRLLPSTGTGVVRLEVIGLIVNWRGPAPLPQAFYLSLGPEGGSFQQPVFGSTRKGEAPRLRITYMLPNAVERP